MHHADYEETIGMGTNILSAIYRDSCYLKRKGLS